MSTRLIALCSAILLVAAVSRATAQEPAPVVDSGARVRLSTDSGTIVGSLVRADSGGFWVSADPSREQVFVSRQSVKRLEVGLGTRSHAGQGALAGFFIGAGVGVIAGVAEGSDPPNAFIGFSAGDKAAILGLTLGGVGAALGALVGAGATEDDWHEYRPSDVHVTLRSYPRGVGLGMSISF